MALERSERMHRHFEDEWLLATGRQSRTEHDNNNENHACIFPQPGCDMDVLDSPAWRAAAANLLEKYSAKQEGTPYQGCCCGHTHRSIDAKTAARLRAAGFLVMNAAYPEEDSP